MLNPKQTDDNWFQRLGHKIKMETRWFAPGTGYRRWMVLAILGAMFLGLGLALIILQYYRTTENPNMIPVLEVLSLRFLSRPIRFVLFGGLGSALIFLGIWGANRALLRPFEKNGRPVWDTISHYRQREKGIKIVVIGGGHGLSSLLRGIKEYTHNVTAIVTVADDGGSSGELRKDMGVLPPGDIRNCLAALSDDEALLSQVFQYRFRSGTGLEGHSLGNLLITALSEITGSFEEAVAESGRVLAIYGKVLPSTLASVQLVGDLQVPETGEIVQINGESKLTNTPGKILRVWLDPNDTLAYPPTISAILNADLIIIGPGSLYTSLLPNLLVMGLSEAIESSKAEKYFICNVATERGETDNYSASDHLRVLERHVGRSLFDLVICNKDQKGQLAQDINWVKADEDIYKNYKVYEANLADDLYPWRHDSKKLAKAIINLFEERTGPLL